MLTVRNVQQHATLNNTLESLHRQLHSLFLVICLAAAKMPPFAPFALIFLHHLTEVTLSLHINLFRHEESRPDEPKHL